MHNQTVVKAHEEIYKDELILRKNNRPVGIVIESRDASVI